MFYDIIRSSEGFKYLPQMLFIKCNKKYQENWLLKPSLLSKKPFEVVMQHVPINPIPTNLFN